MILARLAMAFVKVLLIACIIAGKIVQIGDWSMYGGDKGEFAATDRMERVEGWAAGLT